MKKILLMLHAFIKADSMWWLLYDAAISLFALRLSYAHIPYLLYTKMFWNQLVFLPFWVLISGIIAGIYDRDILVNFWKLIFSLAIMSSLTVFGMVIFTNVILFEKIGRFVLIDLAVYLLFMSFVLRFIVYGLLRYFKIRVLFIGDESLLKKLKKRTADFHGRYVFIGFCDKQDNSSKNALGSFDAISEICRQNKINLLIVSSKYMKYPYLLGKCFELIRRGCNVIDENLFFEQAFSMVMSDNIDPSWFYTARLTVHNNIQVVIKRTMDLFFSIFGLLGTTILFPLIWMTIKLTSGGKVLYSQMRCGQFGQPFVLYKFRTMRNDAEEGKAQWAKYKDSRITFIGRFLRKTRLDELPQFWNVLRGEMSFVGPRPERPELVNLIEKESPYFSFRHLVKPGITGHAQIGYRYGENVEDAKEKLKYDLYYIKNWSILLDIKIIFRTISAVMKGSR